MKQVLSCLLRAIALYPPPSGHLLPEGEGFIPSAIAPCLYAARSG